MLFSVFKIQLASAYRSILTLNRRKIKSPNRLRTLLFVLLAVYVLGSMLSSITMMFYSMASQLTAISMDYLYLALVALVAFMFSFVFTVFSAQSMLFQAKDNQLLLALPIKPAHILGGRMLVLYVLELVSTLLFLLPAVGVYVYLKPPGMVFYPIFVLAALLLPLLGLTLAALFGYIISCITARMRNKPLFITTFSLVLIAAYVVIYTQLMSGMSALLTRSGEIATAIKTYLPPFHYLADSLLTGNLVSLGAFLLCCAAPFGLIYFWLAKSFVKLATATQRTKRVEYKSRLVKAGGVRKALLMKELRKFLSTPPYLLNAGLSFLLNIVLGVYVLIQGSGIITQLATQLPGIGQHSVLMLTGVLLFISAMAMTTAPSISLEGSSLWILKSLPVKTMDVLHAKIKLNLLFGFPTILFAAVCIMLGLGLGWQELLILALVPAAMQVFVAVYGLLCNLRFPKLDAANDTIVVKQSASVLVTMLACFGVLGALVGISIPMVLADLPVWVIAAAGFGVIVLADIIGYSVLRTKGVKAFERL